jgi:hypothetical protein
MLGNHLSDMLLVPEAKPVLGYDPVAGDGVAYVIVLLRVNGTQQS